MAIDYEMISRILGAADQVYPQFLHIKDVVEAVLNKDDADLTNDDLDKLVYHFNYLKDNKFITMGSEMGTGGVPPFITITNLGIDFLTDDGGLSAKLKTITIKFDLDNLREIVAEGILKSGLPEEKEGIIRKAIKSAPETAIKEITTKLIGSALENPAAAAKIVAASLGITF
ncbi:hypothetical protein [Maridesulfovibrio sp.]|uniref:hypothetical protein n=1 Tax=Maridesulfovibrio sp. TaxID=2795000 RepID=UPI0029CA13C4|nr:hypothetical protein [Maridesulfovibrio sp.]